MRQARKRGGKSMKNWMFLEDSNNRVRPRLSEHCTWSVGYCVLSVLSPPQKLRRAVDLITTITIGDNAEGLSPIVPR